MSGGPTIEDVIATLLALDAKVDKVLGALDTDGLLDLPGFEQWSGLSRAMAYKLITSGELQSIKVGGRRLIPVASARKWLAGQTEKAS